MRYVHIDPISGSKPVTKHTRSKRDGTSIVCPKCNHKDMVYHFSWSALVCQECKAKVNKYDWRIA